MIVLQLGPYPPPHGGVQTNLVAIRNHLRRQGISAPVINLTRHQREDSDGVFYPRTAWQVLKGMLRIPADIVHLHIGGLVTARLLGLCLMCSVLPGRRLVLTFHSGGYPSMRRARRTSRWSMIGFVFRRLDAIIAVNEEIAALCRRVGVDPARIHVISPYAPVSPPPHLALPDHLVGFRRAHAPLLTTVGLLEPEYDLRLQIAALADVRQRFPRAGLIIVGSGSLDSELRRVIASSPVGEHVLLAGDLQHHLTLRLLAESDLFLRTTLYDGDSVSVREALALGIPVIATDNGMRPEGVRLIARSDAAALRDAIESVVTEPAGDVRRDQTGSDSLDRVLELYSTMLCARSRASTLHAQRSDIR